MSPFAGGRHAVGRVHFPLKVSGDGRYLVDARVKPFFINGDTPWLLFTQISEDDAETYLATRAAQGYNTVLAELIERGFSDNRPSNFYSEAPFTGANFTTPNSSYFARCDRIIASAARKGMLVMLSPLYIGFDAGSEGWGQQILAASTADIESWGTFLGNRYKDTTNVMWVIGGDEDPTAQTGMVAKCDAFVAAIQATGDTHPVTFHSQSAQSARSVISSSWLNVNNVYRTSTNVPAAANTEYDRSPFMPSFLIESWYENEHSTTDLLLRSQAYWAVLSGATLGHLFGSCPTWHFNSVAGGSFCDTGTTWQTQLTTTAGRTVALVGQLFRSRRFHLLVPDTGHSTVTAGYSSGATLVTTARASDGSSVISYLPGGSGTTLTVDMTKVGGSTARQWWWNPRTAVATQGSDYSTTGTQDFTAPDTSDWVLVLDNTAVYTTAPGSGL